MVIYTCECCNYETPNITNHKRHLLTQKHINNDKFVRLKDEIIILKNDTTKINEKVNNLKDNTTKINQIVNNLKDNTTKINDKVNNLKDNTIKINDKVNNLKDNTKKINLTMNNLKDDTEKIKIDTKNQINNAVIKQNKFNRSVMTILTQEFAENPSLEKINEEDFIKELELEYNAKINEKDCKLQLLIIQDFKNKRLIDTISKLILKFLKKEETSLQSIFNTDCSRGNYATKLDSTWLNDKFGMKLRDIILRPIIEYTINALEPLRNKIAKLTELNRKSPSLDKSDYIMENSNYLLEVNFENNTEFEFYQEFSNTQGELDQENNGNRCCELKYQSLGQYLRIAAFSYHHLLQQKLACSYASAANR